MSKKMKGNLLLLLTAFIWGTAFVAQKSAMDYIGPFTFSGVRLLIAAVTLAPVLAFFEAQKKKDPEYREPSAEEKKQERKMVLIGGGCVGAVLFIAGSFQQVGIVYTTAGKAGFITALYMVLVPIVSWILFRKKIRPIVWACVAAGAVGLYLLCVPPGEGFTGINRGDIIMLGSALSFCFHILVIDHFSPLVDGVKLSMVQFITAGVLSMICVPIYDLRMGFLFNAEVLMDGIIPLLYSGVLSAGIGYTLQILAQKDTDPTIASLLMSLESVFAVIAGSIILHEQLGVRGILGCALMFAANIVVQLPEKEEK